MLNTDDFTSTSSTLVYIIEVTCFGFENTIFKAMSNVNCYPGINIFYSTNREAQTQMGG